MSTKRSLDTICIQGGWEPKNGEPRQLPIYQSTTDVYKRQHGYRNVAEQNVTYTYNKKGPSGLAGFSAAAYFDPDGYMKMEAEYTGHYEEYILSKLYNETYPEVFPPSKNKFRF